MQTLTPWLVDRVRDGDAILFLGAGAARGAVGPKGERAVTGFELRDQIADRFLGGQHKGKALTRVADYAKNESSLTHVQTFIRDIFNPLVPPSFLDLIPRFRWFSIVTTNYDLLLERTYERVADRLQNLRPILRDGDNFSDVLRDDSALPYLKLHGCISTISDDQLPLILASEEYARHRKNRERLFRHFADWARERPVIFCGYDISDPNIVQILFDLEDLGIRRPLFAVVDPLLDDIATRYWSARRFVPVQLTFQGFLESLDAEIPAQMRKLAGLRSHAPLSFQKWVSTHQTPSDRLRAYLDKDLSHVYPSMPVSGCDPKVFFAGSAVGWAPIAQNLDVKRRLADDVILDTVIAEPDEDPFRVALVRGHAGAGLSVLLRRIAWDSASDFGALTFYLNEGAVLRPDLIGEIAELTSSPLLLVVDDALIHIKDIQHLARLSRKNRWPFNVVLGVRTNELNVTTSEFEGFSTDDYELRDLSDAEIRSLLDKLEANESLGELAKLSGAERVERFRTHLSRQLLVALHEATSGKPFEEIVYDEYDRIAPASAKLLYLDVCTLHRLGVPVRAGLVSRVSGISFAMFQNELFRPLEHVVFTYLDTASRDYVYRSRHSTIAEFVFNQALPDPIERATQIMRILRGMDVDYESDEIAFAKLIKGKILADLFADKQIVSGIFQAALESGAESSFVNHQKAVFELNHPSGDMRAALAAIRTAKSENNRNDKSIEHTHAIVLRRLALETSHQFEKDRYRAEAIQIFRNQQKSSHTAHAVTAHGQVLLDQLFESLEGLSDGGDGTDDLAQRTIADQIRVAEQTIFSGLQSFPGDEYLLALDARLGSALSDNPRAISSLRKAFDANPARPFIAVRLARTLAKTGHTSDALEVLEKCLIANPTSKEAHLELAMLSMKQDETGNTQKIGYHLKRSYTEGDSNFTAQFWAARHEFLFGNRDDGMAMFSQLRRSKLPPQLKRKLQGLVKDANGEPVVYNGIVKSVHQSYCFVACTDLRTDVIIFARSFPQLDWEAMHSGGKISFQVIFSMGGPEGNLPRLRA